MEIIHNFSGKSYEILRYTIRAAACSHYCNIEYRCYRIGTGATLYCVQQLARTCNSYFDCGVWRGCHESAAGKCSYSARRLFHLECSCNLCCSSRKSKRSVLSRTGRRAVLLCGLCTSAESGVFHRCYSTGTDPLTV